MKFDPEIDNIKKKNVQKLLKVVGAMAIYIFFLIFSLIILYFISCDILLDRKTKNFFKLVMTEKRKCGLRMCQYYRKTFLFNQKILF